MFPELIGATVCYCVVALANGLQNVCDSTSCAQLAKLTCCKIHPCGHPCGGCVDETLCLPCLHGCDDSLPHFCDADDFCQICWTDSLRAAPAIRLDCGHVVHYACVREMVERRWNGPAISFSPWSQCPSCKVELSHPLLEDLMEPARLLRREVERLATMRLEFEKKVEDPAITEKGGQFYQNPTAFALNKYNYYICFKCSRPYFGGERACERAAGGDFDPSELVCAGCSAGAWCFIDESQSHCLATCSFVLILATTGLVISGAGGDVCPKHGTDYLEHKCRYCCSVACWFCFGTTHFCDPCHDRAGAYPHLTLHGWQ